MEFALIKFDTPPLQVINELIWHRSNGFLHIMKKNRVLPNKQKMLEKFDFLVRLLVMLIVSFIC
jgi:hypothetical protein